MPQKQKEYRNRITRNKQENNKSKHQPKTNKTTQT